jgi:hypothetical protein
MLSEEHANLFPWTACNIPTSTQSQG